MEDNNQYQNNSKKRRNMFIVGPLILLIALVGITYAFFNYTRTGLVNNIGTGRIYFNSTQGNTLYLTNMFPIASSEINNANLDSISINIIGDTTYNNGQEFLISFVDVNNTIVSGSTEKRIPINYVATYTATPVATGEDPNNIGTSSNDYFSDRGSTTAIYKLNAIGNVTEDRRVLIGYIPANVAVNGTLTIKAYLDASRIAISDTYPSGDVTHIESSGETSSQVLDYTNDTTSEWVQGRTILTTSEWNSLQNTPISFKIKAESNEGIWVKETGEEKVRKAINTKINAETNSCNPTWTDNGDGIVYFSGTNDCVDMNYVWYSGKLWRITAIYPDGAMKLVTQNNITSIAFNEDEAGDFYLDETNKSHMYEWLNEDFYDTLYHASSFITTKLWNATMQNFSYVNSIPQKPINTNLVNSNVGLLDVYEYYNSYRCINSNECNGSGYSSYGNGYLNNNYHWWLITPIYFGNHKYVWYVQNSGGFYSDHSSVISGVRPSIVLNSKVEFIGEGTIISPYRIVGDKETGQANDLVNTRLSGEYVKLENGNNEQIFRIIGVENNKTKIISMDYADNKNYRKFASNSSDVIWGEGTTTNSGTWYDYLNNTYLPNLKNAYGELFDSNIYYLGTTGYNYKLSVCASATSDTIKDCNKTNQVGTFNIGLPRYGEMFATQQAGGHSHSYDMWIMSSFSSNYVISLDYNSDGYSHDSSYYYQARPTVHLKSTVKIISGSGTETDPYVVGL